MNKKVVGIEQVGDKMISHYRRDFRPLAMYVSWAVLMLVVLLVATDCDNSGMYQGPNDDAPRYGGPK